MVASASVRAQTGPVKFTTETGVRVVVQPDNNSDNVAICVFVGAGIADDGAHPGLGSLVSRAIFSRNQNLSSEEVNRSIYDVGGSLEATWNPDYTLIPCVPAAPQFHDAFYLICQALKFPEFDRQGFERARAEVIAQA